MKVGQQLASGVRSLSVGGSGNHAWVRLYDETPVTLATRTESGIVLTLPDGIAKTANEADVQMTADGEGMWIVPKTKGMWVASKTGVKSYPKLVDYNFVRVYASDQGRLGWLETDGKGICLVDRRGNEISVDGSVLLLPGETIRSVWSGPNLGATYLSGEYVWMATESHRLYGFRGHVDGNNNATVVPLAGGLPISNRPGGEPLYVEIVRPGSGGAAWIVTTPSSVRHDWDRVWFLRVNSDNAVSASPIDSALYGGRRPTTLFNDFPSPDTVWIRTADYNLYEIKAGSTEVAENPFKALPVSSIMASDRPSRLWVTTPLGMYLVGPASEFTAKVSVQLGGEKFIEPGLSPELKGQLDVSEAEVSVKPFAGNDSAAGRVNLSFAPAGESGDMVAMGEAVLDPNGRAKVPLFVRSPFRAGIRYTVALTYTDNRFFEARLEWPSVAFRPSWWQHPYVRASGLLLGPILLLCLLLQRYPEIRRWVPVAVPGLELAVARINPQWLSIAPQDFLAFAAMTLLATLVAALWSPALLRTLAGLYPYRALVPAVMQIPQARRRFFAAYLRDLRAAVARIRREASGESYVRLPCTVVDHSDAPGAGETPTNVDSIDHFVIARDPSDRKNLLLEAPGGRGKSALLHEILNRAITAFDRDPRCPLPLLFDPRATSAKEMIRLGLGRHELSEEYSLMQLSGGHVVVFMDAADESASGATLLESLFNTPGIGQHTRVCAAARPSRHLREVFQKSEQWMVVRPERLTADNVRQFAQAYAASDYPGEAAAQTEALARLEKILPVAQSADGTYLALLVRFAMLLEGKAESIADLYQGTLDRLLRRSGHVPGQQLDAAAERLAMESYWTSQERTFAFDRPTQEACERVEELLRVGILIEAEGAGGRLRQKPRSVRFLHDSMQSYLVAKSLYAAGDWTVLLRAAGDSGFSTAGSELLPGAGSEVFQMCVHVFQPASRLRSQLSRELLGWAEQFGPNLAVEQIRRALPESMVDSADQALAKDMAAGAYLVAAIRLVGEAPVALSSVVHIYGALARTVYPLHQAAART